MAEQYRKIAAELSDKAAHEQYPWRASEWAKLARAYSAVCRAGRQFAVYG
jgi:hypothetical protein